MTQAPGGFCAVEVGAGTGGFTRQVLDRLDRNAYESLLCWLTQAPGGFCAAEVGAGTGGFTRQVLDRLDRNATTELVRYTATDVTPSFRQALLDRLASPKLAFQVRSSGGLLWFRPTNLVYALLAHQPVLACGKHVPINLADYAVCLVKEYCGHPVARKGLCEVRNLAVCVQVWDINEPAPAALGEPVGLITASNAVHTCIDLPSGPSSKVMQHV